MKSVSQSDQELGKDHQIVGGESEEPDEVILTDDELAEIEHELFDAIRETRDRDQRKSER